MLLPSMCTFVNLMLILILIDGYVNGMFWASQKDEMVNITPHLIPTPCKKNAPFLEQNFQYPHIGTVSPPLPLPPPTSRGYENLRGNMVPLKTPWILKF